MNSLLKNRLSLLLETLKIKDYEVSEILIAKILELGDIEQEIDLILEDIMFKDYTLAYQNLTKYINTMQKTHDITIYEDKEFHKLQRELKKLEKKLQSLSEQKAEYLNDIEEFNTQYNLHLGSIIENILNLKKEILYKQTIKKQKLKEQYAQDHKTYNETKETVDELKSTIDELKNALDNIDESHEQYDEIYKAYQELQDELEELEDALYSQEQKLNDIKEEIDDDEVLEEYEEAKQTYEDYHREYEYIKEENSVVLNEDEKKELKTLWKKACKLCHPDIVIDKFKEKAHEIMQMLNDAYSKKDISKVKEILNSLENGTTFEISSDVIEDKQLLKAKIEELEESIKRVINEIEEIKTDDTFVTISELDDWDAYFEELKAELKKQEEVLKDEAIGILEEKNSIEQERVEQWIQNLWDWADTNQIPNAKLPRKRERLLRIKTIDFTNIKIKNLPSEICNLENIEELILWDCNLAYLPKEIVKFTKLKKLQLRGNPNLKLIPSQKNWLENLEKQSTVFKEEIGSIDDNTLNKYEKNNFDNKLTSEEVFEIVYNWILNQFQSIHDVKSLLRIKDEAKKVANDLVSKNRSLINLRFINTTSGVQNLSVQNVTYQTFNIAQPQTEQVIKENVKKTTTTSKKIKSENSPYSNHIQNIENPNFEKIRRYCNSLVNDNNADQMQKNLAESGKMRKALIYDALEQFIEKFNNQTITLIDWSCNQGIASMLVLDYIKEKQLDVKVNQILLIDNDHSTLGRAMAQIEALNFDSAKIDAFNSLDIKISDALKTIKNDTTLNLLTNDKMPVDYIDIDFTLLKEAYFIAISNNNGDFVDEVHKNIKVLEYVHDMSIRDGKIGRFSKFERVFRVNG
ncbi:MAG: hypothetical protein PHX44_01395 [Sulfurimonas sp.]|uniref:hypothetical protein n=1 Tax=Sulfurimonas sp. TaxID=2022749 RepID=UPI0026311891|nr:hypothetical protein [Sulfurimonas sp.]MDD2651688.1 hypothetical protein [Sulfurimonas sp.]MDD3451499.1 hypothetical protein [Sulfurimonas sp.]